jgi:hypothetical protein
MCPLSAPRLKFHVARLEIVNASWREPDSSDLFRGLVPSLRAMIFWDFSTSHLFDQSQNLIRSHLWERDVRNAFFKSSDDCVSAREGRYQRIVMSPASPPERDRASENSPAIWCREDCYGF